MGDRLEHMSDENIATQPSSLPAKSGRLGYGDLPTLALHLRRRSRVLGLDQATVAAHRTLVLQPPPPYPLLSSSPSLLSTARHVCRLNTFAIQRVRVSCTTVHQPHPAEA